MREMTGDATLARGLDAVAPTPCPSCGGPVLDFIAHVGPVMGPRKLRYECVRCDWGRELVEP